MATVSDFTFSAYVFASQNAVNAAQVTVATHIRDRFGNVVVAQPLDYVVKDEDGSLRVMKKVTFEAEYSAQGVVTAPSTLVSGAQAATTVDLSWTTGDAAALTDIYQDGVLVGTNAAADNTYTATGLVTATTYAFKVLHRKNERSSAFSNTLSQATA